jgi:hypothetical protein
VWMMTNNVARHAVGRLENLPTTLRLRLLLLLLEILSVFPFQAPAPISGSLVEVLSQNRQSFLTLASESIQQPESKREDDDDDGNESTIQYRGGNNDKDDNTPYLLDEYGRPISIKQNSEWMVLQTPHSGRKFRQTRVDLMDAGSGIGSLRSRLRSCFTPFVQRVWRQRYSHINQSYPRRRRRRMRKNTNRKRFTEGWYYRLTLPAYNESFVFIFSIEDAGRVLSDGTTKSPLTLACMQLLGPNDTYLVQSDDDDTKFWGWKHAQALGCTFEWKENYLAKIKGGDPNDGGNDNPEDYIAAMTPEEWRAAVSSGFQVLPFHFQGRLYGHDGTRGGVRANQGVPGWAEYDFSLRHVAGWGDYPPLLTNSTTNCSSDGDHPLSVNTQRRNGANRINSNKFRQYSTAGWLASFPVFEPHWQITM